jgi:hypothetical protein
MMVMVVEGFVLSWGCKRTYAGPASATKHANRNHPKRIGGSGPW